MSQPKQRGFTIVELLVVVAIIGMLVAILIPAISMGKGMARQAQCISRQRNLGTAVVTYELTKGRFPGSKNADGRNWAQKLITDILKRKDVDIAGGGKVEDFFCPDDQQALSTTAPLSYLANTKILVDRSGGAAADVNMSQLSSPSRTVMLGEKLGCGPWTSQDLAKIGFQWAGGGSLSSNHSSTIIVTFCDGHVEKLRDDVDANSYLGQP